MTAKTMNKDRIEDSDPIMIDDCIDDVDRACNPLERAFQPHIDALRL